MKQIRETFYLTEDEMKAVLNFVSENKSCGYYFIPDRSSGIGTNKTILTNEAYWKLRNEYKDKEIPWEVRNKAGKDITDYGSW